MFPVRTGGWSEAAERQALVGPHRDVGASTADSSEHGDGRRVTSGRTIRTLLPLLIIALLFAACGSPADHGSEPARSADKASSPLGRGLLSRLNPPPSCHSAQLTLTITNAGVATGSAVIAGTFENRSSTTCTLAGYPALQLLNAHGEPVVTTARREAPRPSGATSTTVPQRIDVGPGQQASFTITTSDGNQLAPQLPPCPRASSLLVTPPGTTHGLQATIPSGPGQPPGLTAYPYSPGEPCGTVTVSALIPGSGERALCPACYPPPAAELPTRRSQRAQSGSRPADHQ